VYWRAGVLENNTRRCVKKQQRKTEQWEDKSSYIHRFSSPDIVMAQSSTQLLVNTYTVNASACLPSAYA
jgi:hypothetical protein